MSAVRPSTAGEPPLIADYVQDVLARVLTLRPEKPIEFIAEYFRTAAALDALPASAVASAAFTAPLVLHSAFTAASTPVTRACVLIRATDPLLQPALFDAQLATAFDELAAAAALPATPAYAPDGLLGSLLLARPTAKSSHALGFRGIGRSKASSSSPFGDEATFVDLIDFRSLLQLVASKVPAAGVAIPVDFASSLVVALTEEALAASTHATPSTVVPQSARSARNQVPSPSLISFAAFSAGVRDLLQLQLLYTQLAELLLSLRPVAASAMRTSEQRLRQLQSGSLSAGEAIELLRALSKPPPPSSSAASNDSASSPLSLAHVRSILASLHLSVTSFDPAVALAPLSFVRGVLVAHRDSLLEQRRVARSQQHRALQEQQERDVADGAVHAANSFDASTAATYAAAFHNNPARRGTLTPYEEPETIEYS